MEHFGTRERNFFPNITEHGKIAQTLIDFQYYVPSVFSTLQRN
jgi:hypothetical protein